MASRVEAETSAPGIDPLRATPAASAPAVVQRKEAEQGRHRNRGQALNPKRVSSACPARVRRRNTDASARADRKNSHDYHWSVDLTELRKLGRAGDAVAHDQAVRRLHADVGRAPTSRLRGIGGVAIAETLRVSERTVRGDAAFARAWPASEGSPA